MLRHSPDILLELAIDGRLLFVSDALRTVLARDPDDIVGRSFLEIVAPEDREVCLAAFRKVVESGAEPVVRLRALRSDGLRVQLEASVRPFVDDDGTRRIVGVARDVTDSTHRQAITRRRDDYYRAIVETGGRPSAVLSADGSVIFSNQAFKRSFGQEEALSSLLLRIGDEARLAMDSAWYASTRPDQPGVGSVDIDLVQEDGQPVWLDATWHAFQDEAGERRFAVVFDDITQRKQIELALRAIAQDSGAEGPDALRENLARVAVALGFQRLVVGEIDPEAADRLRVLHAWQDGGFQDVDALSIGDLPEATVARGETCILPSDLRSLVPIVGDLVGHDVEAFAGLPLRRADGTTCGLVAGYSAHPIRDLGVTRSLLAAYATQAAAALDRRRAAEEIRAARDRFEALARQSREILTEVDAEGRITWVSPAFETLLGFAPDDAIGRHVDAFVHPEDRRVSEEVLEELRGGRSQTLRVLRARHLDGSWRWIESRTTAFRGSDGGDRAIILSRDVTEKRTVELGHNLLYRVVQQSGDLVFVCEPGSGRLLYANRAAARRLALPDRSASADAEAALREDLATRTLLELVPEEEAERLRNEVLPEVTPTRSWEGELQLRPTPEAEPIPTEATIFLLNDDEHQPLCLAVILRDIGARRSAEEALRQSELRLNQAQKMEAVGRLAGGIAHDFNNLLTAIIGYSDLVLDEIGPDHLARRDAEEILRAAERAGGLTRQLLAFSRRQVLQPESVDLNAIVAAVDNMMRRLIGEHIKLVTALEGELRRVVADPGQLEQVLVNLLLNARDAMPDGGQLRIETSNARVDRSRRVDTGVLEPGDYVALRVADDGHGMDAATRAQIFEPFFTTKKAHQGTGLGLATVYGIVSQSGGQIEVETEPDVGTTFSILLPAVKTTAEPDEEDDADLSPGGRETILLVEDAATVRRLVQRTLEKVGYEVLPAESATAALRHCSRHEGTIDLLLTDVVLPGHTGPEVAERARELRPGIRVLYMSGFTDDTLVRHGIEPNEGSLLQKPFSPSTVLTRVREKLDEP